MDIRIEKLSKLLVNYSCNIQKNEKVLISYEGADCKPLIRQLIKEVYAVGGVPYVEIRDSSITREILLGATEEQIAFKNEIELAQMKGMQAYIA
ncbi:MAG: aminopeptidase, partial [Anaerovoracaceae bacterium]